MQAFDFKEALKNSLYTGMIDAEHISLEPYRPRLLVNQHQQGKKVLTSLIHELRHCDTFFFSVAFLTYSGVLILLDTLQELEARNIKGKILASQYLNFTEPKALKKLLNFTNIELRMMTNEDLHAKGYIFRRREQYNLIIGSSNLTQHALCDNKEWNVKLTSTHEGALIQETLSEFEDLFEQATVVDEAFIHAYEAIYQQQRLSNKRKPLFEIGQASDSLLSFQTIDLKPKIIPNAMQLEALVGIEAIRDKGEKKALLVSATGTGKTFLSAFDVARFKPKRLLFLAHREQLLNQASESFKAVLGDQLETAIVGGGQKNFKAPFIFATVQTMAKTEILEHLPEDTFDYMIIDESHRAGANSYQKILGHFNPKFLLGMTATPERTDEYNICRDFDYNIAYEIRLEQAMAEKMLCPFHYFGITEIAVEGEIISEYTDFRYLVSDERVNHIIEQVRFYGFDGDRVKGLVFCSRNEEAKALSEAFNQRGYQTVALSGSDTQSAREAAIERLESDDGIAPLDYIFTVDIFNEGVDIPTINQVVMLRPTSSAIVFVQQLGRGLRKVQGKTFVVVLDFIGNYQNNFMIPMALSDDRSYNKDTIRRFVAEGSRVIPGCSTIHFDEIAKRKIYESIDQVNFNGVAFIKESYQNLKYRLGKIPTYMDFEAHDALDLARLFENNALGSYHKFLEKYEEDYTLRLNLIQDEMLEFISKKLAVGKRPHELLVLKALIEGKEALLDEMTMVLTRDYGITCQSHTRENVFHVLTNRFATGSAKNTYKNCLFLREELGQVVAYETFLTQLEDEGFKSALKDLVAYGLYRNAKYYGKRYRNTSFQLYQKYGYEDVCRLLEWKHNVVSLNIGGYKYDAYSKTYPVFINYHKDEAISDSIKYEDAFLSNTTLKAISKSKRTVTSNDVITAYQAKQKGVRMELFVRKNKDDQQSKEFYYLGRMETIGEPKGIVMGESGLNAVELLYHLDVPVREDLYEYFTEG